MRLIKSILLVSSLLSGAAHASLKEVAERENAVNQLADAFYRYERVRDTYVLGNRGIMRSAQNFSTGVRQWLEAWRSGSTRIRGGSGSLLDLSSEVSSFIRQQHAEYLRLKAEGDQITSNLQSIDLVLRQSKGLKGNENIDHLITRLNSLEAELTHISNSLRQEVAAELLEMERILTVFNHDFFLARLKERAISQGIDSTSPTYTGAADFIRAEALGGPLVLGIENQANEIIAMMLRFETFSLKKNLPAFNNECDRAKVSISRLGLSQAQVARLHAEIETSRDEVQTRFNQTIKIYSDPELVETMNRTKVRSYRRHCNGSNPTARCDIYQRMATIDRTILNKYNPKSLATVEESWKIFEESIK